MTEVKQQAADVKWLYRRDYESSKDLNKAIDFWTRLQYRVFVQGYSAMDCVVFEPQLES